MKEQILDADKQRVLQLQSGLVREQEFFLAGGTGLGIRLRHRVSRDLDWFTPRVFDAGQLAQRLDALPEKLTQLTVQGSNTLRAYYGSLETSFLRYAQVPAKPELVTIGELKVPSRTWKR